MTRRQLLTRVRNPDSAESVCERSSLQRPQLRSNISLCREIRRLKSKEWGRDMWQAEERTIMWIRNSVNMICCRTTPPIQSAGESRRCLPILTTGQLHRQRSHLTAPPVVQLYLRPLADGFQAFARISSSAPGWPSNDLNALGSETQRRLSEHLHPHSSLLDHLVGTLGLEALGLRLNPEDDSCHKTGRRHENKNKCRGSMNRIRCPAWKLSHLSESYH